MSRVDHFTVTVDAAECAARAGAYDFDDRFDVALADGWGDVDPGVTLRVALDPDDNPPF